MKRRCLSTICTASLQQYHYYYYYSLEFRPNGHLEAPLISEFLQGIINYRERSRSQDTMWHLLWSLPITRISNGHISKGRFIDSNNHRCDGTFPPCIPSSWRGLPEVVRVVIVVIVVLVFTVHMCLPISYQQVPRGSTLTCMCKVARVFSCVH